MNPNKRVGVFYLMIQTEIRTMRPNRKTNHALLSGNLTSSIIRAKRAKNTPRVA